MSKDYTREKRTWESNWVAYLDLKKKGFTTYEMSPVLKDCLSECLAFKETNLGMLTQGIKDITLDMMRALGIKASPEAQAYLNAIASPPAPPPLFPPETRMQVIRELYGLTFENNLHEQENIEPSDPNLVNIALASITNRGSGINSDYYLDNNNVDIFLDDIKFLLEKGADINYPGTDGYTPLMRCLRDINYITIKPEIAINPERALKEVQFLLDNGATPTIKEFGVAMRNNSCPISVVALIKDKVGSINKRSLHDLFNHCKGHMHSGSECLLEYSNKINFILNNLGYMEDVKKNPQQRAEMLAMLCLFPKERSANEELRYNMDAILTNLLESTEKINWDAFQAAIKARNIDISTIPDLARRYISETLGIDLNLLAALSDDELKDFNEAARGGSAELLRLFISSSSPDNEKISKIAAAGIEAFRAKGITPPSLPLSTKKDRDKALEWVDQVTRIEQHFVEVQKQSLANGLRPKNWIDFADFISKQQNPRINISVVPDLAIKYIAHTLDIDLSLLKDRNLTDAELKQLDEAARVGREKLLKEFIRLSSDEQICKIAKAWIEVFSKAKGITPPSIPLSKKENIYQVLAWQETVLILEIQLKHKRLIKSNESLGDILTFGRDVNWDAVQITIQHTVPAINISAVPALARKYISETLRISPDLLKDPYLTDAELKQFDEAARGGAVALIQKASEFVGSLDEGRKGVLDDAVESEAKTFLKKHGINVRVEGKDVVSMLQSPQAILKLQEAYSLWHNGGIANSAKAVKLAISVAFDSNESVRKLWRLVVAYKMTPAMFRTSSHDKTPILPQYNTPAAQHVQHELPEDARGSADAAFKVVVVGTEDASKSPQGQAGSHAFSDSVARDARAIAAAAGVRNVAVNMDDTAPTKNVPVVSHKDERGPSRVRSNPAKCVFLPKISLGKEHA